MIFLLSAQAVTRLALRAVEEELKVPRWVAAPGLEVTITDWSAELLAATGDRTNLFDGVGVSREMQRMREWIVAAYSKTSFVAKTDHQATLKNLPQVSMPGSAAMAGSGPQTVQGQWKNLDGKYQITITSAGREADLAATVEGDRITIAGEGMNLVFSRED